MVKTLPSSGCQFDTHGATKFPHAAGCGTTNGTGKLEYLDARKKEKQLSGPLFLVSEPLSSFPPGRSLFSTFLSF